MQKLNKHETEEREIREETKGNSKTFTSILLKKSKDAAEIWKKIQHPGNSQTFFFATKEEN